MLGTRGLPSPSEVHQRLLRRQELLRGPQEETMWGRFNMRGKMKISTVHIYHLHLSNCWRGRCAVTTSRGPSGGVRERWGLRRNVATTRLATRSSGPLGTSTDIRWTRWESKVCEYYVPPDLVVSYCGINRSRSKPKPSCDCDNLVSGVAWH